jgi:hypothetical protein
MKISIRTWYGVPELQLPLELLVCHIFFLSLLDNHKDIIGRLQYWWLLNLSRHFGLTQSVLPCVDISAHKTLRLSGTADPVDTIKLNDEVCLVLRRPPKGWDNKSARVSVST